MNLVGSLSIFSRRSISIADGQLFLGSSSLKKEHLLYRNEKRLTEGYLLREEAFL